MEAVPLLCFWGALAGLRHEQNLLDVRRLHLAVVGIRRAVLVMAARTSYPPEGSGVHKTLAR